MTSGSTLKPLSPYESHGELRQVKVTANLVLLGIFYFCIPFFCDLLSSSSGQVFFFFCSAFKWSVGDVVAII